MIDAVHFHLDHQLSEQSNDDADDDEYMELRSVTLKTGKHSNAIVASADCTYECLQVQL